MENLVEIKNVSFSYFEDEYVDETETEIKTTETKVFDNISLNIPYGITSCIGQNGTGKSTLMLLSAGVFLPTGGTITLAGHNTVDITDEEKRQNLVAFVYQNMEFDTDEPVGNLLKFVYNNGYHKEKNDKFLQDVIEVFELTTLLDRPTDVVSKGEMQRVVLAFSILYGTPIVMMDEPVFACEDYQKDRIFSFIKSYAQQYKVSIIYSAHELELSQKYSDNLIIFYKDQPPKIGKTSELFTEQNLEEAYQAPYASLKHREAFYREGLNKQD